MRAILVTTFIILSQLTGCGGDPNKLPEFNGVYARYSDGTLVKLDGVPTHTSAWLDFKGSISFSEVAKARSYLRDYVLQPPAITLESKRINAFIIKGGEQKQQGFPKWLIGRFAATKDIEGKPFENSGPGDKETMFMRTTACGSSDGMLYNEPEPGTYVFLFPVTEKEGYKFCNLISGGASHHSHMPSTSIWVPKANKDEFFGIWHDGLTFTFHMQ